VKDTELAILNPCIFNRNSVEIIANPLSSWHIDR